MTGQRSLSIFGATGSIGLSTLDLVRQHRDQYRLVALTANGNAAELAKLAREFKPDVAVVADEGAIRRSARCIGWDGYQDCRRGRCPG